jgi:hypothetical protein
MVLSRKKKPEKKGVSSFSSVNLEPHLRLAVDREWKIALGVRSDN